MALQFGPTKIGAMQYNGVTIGEAMYNGQIVYRSALPIVSFVDNFTAPELHPRWTLTSGNYTPPGLGGGMSGAQVETQVGSTTCEVGIRGQVGSEQAWIVYLSDKNSGDATLFAGVWFDAGHVAIETEQGDEVSTVQPSPTDTVTLRLSGGVAAVLVNGVVRASAPTGLTGEGWLAAAVDGPGPLATPRITYLSYTPA